MNKRDLINYNITREILLGIKSINPAFVPFSEWMEETYDVEIANVTFELVAYPNYQMGEPVPTIEVVFKRLKDFSKFNGENLLTAAVETKQVVEEKFKELIADQRLSQEDLSSENGSDTKNSKDHIKVTFSSFEGVEKNYVRRNIPKDDLEDLLGKINNKDISRVLNYYQFMTIVVYTEEQEGKYLNSEEFEKWEDLFFELIQKHNRLVFFKRASLKICLNSEERMDKTNFGELSFYK